MACLFWPNGCNPHTWTPKGRGRDFEFSPILQPLARHKDDVLILTHLSNRGTFTGDGHYVKDAAWLTGTTIHRTTGSDLNAGGVSMDQLAARRIGVLTPIPSLELGVEPVTTGVDTNVGYTRLYGSHISWSSPTTPVAREINPRLAFDRLFRSQTPAAGARAATTTAASSTSWPTTPAPPRPVYCLHILRALPNGQLSIRAGAFAHDPLDVRHLALAAELVHFGGDELQQLV